MFHTCVAHLQQSPRARSQRHQQELDALRESARREKEAELAHAHRQVRFVQAQLTRAQREFEAANSSTLTKAQREELVMRQEIAQREEAQAALQRELDLERLHAVQVGYLFPLNML